MPIKKQLWLTTGWFGSCLCFHNVYAGLVDYYVIQVKSFTGDIVEDLCASDSQSFQKLSYRLLTFSAQFIVQCFLERTTTLPGAIVSCSTGFANKC